MSDAFQRLAAIGLALCTFAGAELVGGNGFMAAFVGGLVLGNTSRPICHCFYEFAEAEGTLLILLTFMLFGAVMVPNVALLEPRMLLYAVLSLTVIRMLPIAVSLIGTGAQPETVAFLGWFGPRGVASVLYVIIVLEEMALQANLIFTVMVATVLLSVLLHGVTANPFVRLYANRLEAMEDEAEPMMEEEAVSEMPTREGMPAAHSA